jgi:hypothetical protein
VSTDFPDARTVPIEVLPPVPQDAAMSPRAAADHPPFDGLKTFYHPASGVVILGIDILVFGPEMLSGFLDTPLMCALAFLATFPLVFMIQWKWAKNTMSAAFGKAFLGAFLAGLPFSIAGTMLGAAVIGLSGLPSHPVEMVKRLMSARGTIR